MPSVYELSDVTVQYKQDDLTGSGNGTLASQAGNSPAAKPGGVYISTAKGFILAFLAIAIAVLVGLIVHFAGPDKTFECTCTLSEVGGVAAALEECKKLASSGNLDICSACPTPTSGTCSPASTAPPPEVTSPKITPEVTTTTPADTTTRLATTTTTEAPPVEDVRLPDTLVPTLYTLELQPNFYPPLELDEFTFNGSVKIQFQCRNNTSVITLHSNMINITGAITVTDDSDSDGPDLYQSHNESDRVLQFLMVHTRQELVAGHNYTLDITQFAGPLRQDSHGLFVDSYQRGNQTVYLAASQMQPIYARKAFPCFDEPALKARFDVTLVYKDGMNLTALSNMQQVGEPEDRGDGWVADRFEVTPMMPTYLVAFAVSDFGSKTNYTESNVTFRTWARREVVEDQSTYALDVGIAVQDEFSRYFNSNYPLRKQDMIAIPNLAGLGMENWGLITYRESFMLHQEGESTSADKHMTAALVGHEIAHMWFGNLVTLGWWNELWLNEGFAKYLEEMAMDYYRPDWNVFDRFGYRTVHEAFRSDSLVSTQPLHNDVNLPTELRQIFTFNVYTKGASIVRMMRFMVGDDAFQAALRDYLLAHQYGNVEQDDLWNAFETHTSVDVKAVMDTWTLQNNYPVVMVTFDTAGQISLTQSRYLSEPGKADPGTYPSPYNYTWNIPVACTTSLDPMFNVTSADVIIMNDTTLDIGISGLPAPDNTTWVLVNPMQYGFYRVNYDDTNWDALIGQLNRDHTVIHLMNRAQLINDAWSLANSGNLSLLTALRTTEYLDQERDLVPWETASRELFLSVYSMLKRHPLFRSFTEFMLNKTGPIFSEVTLNNTNATYPEAMRRHVISGIACLYGNRDCVEEAMTMYDQWKSDPESHPVDPDVNMTVYYTAVTHGGLEAWDYFLSWYRASIVNDKVTILTYMERLWYADLCLDPDVKMTVYYTAVTYGGLGAWDYFLARYRAADASAEKTRLLYALTCAREAWQLNVLLEMSLIPEEVTYDDAVHVITVVARNTNGRDIAWSFFVSSYDYMVEYFSQRHMERIISGITEWFNTKHDVDRLNAFIDDREVDDLGETFAKALETAHKNLAWMEENVPVIQSWLGDQGF